MVVVAPTGVAAINARGVTIHSFFQLPFGPILPDGSSSDNKRFTRKFGKDKINIIKSMDLLVIDEISMVRCDVLDGIDQTLRRYKDRNAVFGGVQLLMIGDLQQLSPVVKDNEWRLLSPYYKTPFFFSSQAYNSCNPLSIELKHIYRQDNPVFINILNEIRNNTLSQKSADELNKRFQPDFKPNDEDGYISLTTHNNKAKSVNSNMLSEIKSKTITYNAEIKDKFPEYSYPCNPELDLKVGAQVMFVKNDSSIEKRYFNGKIGKVIYLDKEEVIVKCPDDDFNIEVTPETWENISYSINAETKAISEDKLGSFTQMPLRLAWAITIHKSQGLTFERAIIDAQGAFAHGQTYVALSRCKSLEGLVLRSKIDSRQIISDENVNSFNKNSEENQPSEKELNASKSIFQRALIAEIFDFYGFLNPLNRMLDVFYKNRGSIRGNIDTLLPQMKTEVAGFLKIANGFKQQLVELTDNSTEPDSNDQIQTRFRKAIVYFEEQTKSKIETPLEALVFTTDNKAVKADLEKPLGILEEQLKIKLLYFTELSEGFEVTAFLNLRAKGILKVAEKKRKPRNTFADGMSNAGLYEQLRALRDAIAENEGLPHYMVFAQKSLNEMCEFFPTTEKQLLKINGFGKVRVEQHGEEILEVINAYCNKNNIEPQKIPETKKEPKAKSKPKKGSSQYTSLELFQSGKSIAEIAKKRELVPSTIFGHLSRFVETGEVKVTDLISEAYFKELTELIPKQTYETISELKTQLDDKYSYNDLRLVIKSLEKKPK